METRKLLLFEELSFLIHFLITHHHTVHHMHSFGNDHFPLMKVCWTRFLYLPALLVTFELCFRCSFCYIALNSCYHFIESSHGHLTLSHWKVITFSLTTHLS